MLNRREWRWHGFDAGFWAAAGLLVCVTTGAATLAIVTVVQAARCHMNHGGYTRWSRDRGCEVRIVQEQWAPVLDGKAVRR